MWISEVSVATYDLMKFLVLLIRILREIIIILLLVIIIRVLVITPGNVIIFGVVGVFEVFEVFGVLVFIIRAIFAILIGAFVIITFFCVFSLLSIILYLT